MTVAVTGILSLIGVIISNSRSMTVTEEKRDALTSKAEKHSQVLERTNKLEQDMAVEQNDIETLGHGAEEAK